MIIALNFERLISTFYCQGELELIHSIDWSLFAESYVEKLFFSQNKLGPF